MELTDGIVVGVSATYEKLYENVPNNMMLILFSLCVLSFVTVFLIVKMLDKFILSDIYGTIEGTKKIAAGNLDYRLEICLLYTSQYLCIAHKLKRQWCIIIFMNQYFYYTGFVCLFDSRRCKIPFDNEWISCFHKSFRYIHHGVKCNSRKTTAFISVCDRQAAA